MVFKQRKHSICPINPTLHRGHLIRALNLSPNDAVIDLTNYIDCGDFVAAGMSGRVYKGRWKGVEKSIAQDHQILPPVAVKVVQVPALQDRDEQDRRHKVRALSQAQFFSSSFGGCMVIASCRELNGS